MTQNLAKSFITKTGGGDLHNNSHISQNLAIFLIISTFSLLNATELNTISNCNNSNQECKIDTTYQNQSIQNHNPLSLKQIIIETQLLDFINYGALTLTEYIKINSTDNSVQNFINYGTLTTTSKYSLDTTNTGNGGFGHIYNYGNISGYVYIAGGESSATYIHNYGTMGGAIKAGNSGNQTIYVNNYGIINLCKTNGGNGYDKRSHFKDISLLILQNYMMKINVDSAKFNAFDGNANDNSHLVLDSVNSVIFADKNSKMILDFGSGFEFGAGYKLDKLIVKADKGANALSVDFDRLIPKSDIYALIQSGEYFIAKLTPQHSAISNIYKSNIRTMNNFYTLSNSMIYPRKLYHSQNLTRKNQNNLVILRERSDRRISKSNIRDSSPKAQNDKMNRLQNLKEAQTFSQNQTQTQRFSQTPHNYYFILTPFFNYNSFAKSGNYNLRGFDYGFLTAFSTQVAESNSLGAHFIFSYGSLGDSKDKDLSIKSLNLNVGINYKLDLIYDMYLKARGDFFYFSNALDSLTIKNIKPNNLGFGASVIFGKDFDFKSGGILGIEAGIDYKALKTNEVSLNSQSYKQSLLNLIYADVGVNYSKYFGGFGINFGTGFKVNLAPKLAESTLLINSQNLRFVLDNDKYLAYANAGISYVLNAKNFDMEFSLAYYGNFGDRVISNGGGVEWRVVW